MAAGSPLPATALLGSPSRPQQIHGDVAKLQAPAAPVQARPLGQGQARLREACRTGQGVAARGRGRGRGRGRANRRQAQLAHLLQLLRMAPAEPTGTMRPDAASVNAAGRMEGWLALRARIAAAPETQRAAAWRAVQQAIVQEGVAVLAAPLAEPAAPAPGAKARLRLCMGGGRGSFEVSAASFIFTHRAHLLHVALSGRTRLHACASVASASNALDGLP